MLAAAWKLKRVPPRLRSKGSNAGENGAPVRFGLFAVFDSNPAAAHCPGAVKVGSPAAVPSLEMHGLLKVGSVIPKPKFSSRRVCLRSTPYFKLWRPWVAETSA